MYIYKDTIHYPVCKNEFHGDVNSPSWCFFIFIFLLYLGLIYTCMMMFEVSFGCIYVYRDTIHFSVCKNKFHGDVNSPSGCVF